MTYCALQAPEVARAEVCAIQSILKIITFSLQTLLVFSVITTCATECIELLCTVEF